MRSNVYYVKRYPVASGVVVAGIRRAGLPAGVKIGPGDPADRGRSGAELGRRTGPIDAGGTGEGANEREC